MMTRNSTKVWTLVLLLLVSLTGYGQDYAQKLQQIKKAPPAATEKFNFDHKLLSEQYRSWGLDSSTLGAINIQDAWKYFQNKKDVVVAVVDTGIDPSQQELLPNLYLPKSPASSYSFGIDFSKDHSNALRPTDTNGHGTHVTGIIRSIHPDVKILALKYYNQNASGQDNLNSTIAALRYAVEQNVDIINYSGGGPEPAIEELQILKMAERKGILVVAAAGNEQSNIDDKKNAYYPASYGLKNIITVTAHDQNVNILSSSNYGQGSVHISAPGHRIKSTHLFGRAGYLTGTSQATAFVTGVAALLKAQYPSLDYQQLKDIIISSARKNSNLQGKCLASGILDAASAQRLASKTVHHTEVKRELANKKSDQEGVIIYRKAK